MPPRVPSRICPDQVEGLLPRPHARRRAGLGPVGSSMIDLIGTSLLAQGGSQAQPHAAIWAKI